MESVVVVDNIPKVAPARQEKLKSVIDKLFVAAGVIVNCYYPLDKEGNTKGFCFVEYKNPANAEEAVKLFNNHRLDKTHTFLVNLFTDFNKYSNIPEVWTPPEPQQYDEQNDLYSFITEPDACDQFCVVVDSGNLSQVQFWQNTQPEPTELLKKDVSTRKLVWRNLFYTKLPTSNSSASLSFPFSGLLLEHT